MVTTLIPKDMPADLIVDLEQEDLKFPNGRTLMYILDQDNQEVTDGWLRRTGQDHIEKCTRIKNYDGGRLKPVLQRLLHLKSLCCGMESIGSWDPIYAMHCYEVRSFPWGQIETQLTVGTGDIRIPDHNNGYVDIHPRPRIGS
jgi:hypothetical protein